MSVVDEEIASKQGRCPACGCIGPNTGYNPLSREDMTALYQSLKPGFWVLSEDGLKLKRSFKCRNWQAAIDFISEVSTIAESEKIQHHPDIHLTKYRNIEIVLWTHAAGGLTEYDFKLAKALESLDVDYSPSWLRSNAEAI